MRNGKGAVQPKPARLGRVRVHGTELRLGESHDLHRQKIARITLDSMVQFVGLLDAGGTVLEINQAALNAAGITLADVEGKPFWTTFWWQVSGEINAALRESIRRAAQGEFVRWDTEIFGRSGGKETINIDASLMPVKDEQGNVVFITAECRDITEKKKYEREIARQREELDYLRRLPERELPEQAESRLNMARFRAESAEALHIRTAQFETLLNHAPLGVFLIDSEFRIRQVNPVALPAFGDLPGGLIGRDFAEVMRILWGETYAEEVVRVYRHTLETGESFYMPERAERRADRGVTEYYEWQLHRIPLAEGEFGVVCYFRDISAQVEARNKIARSEEIFRAFVTASSDVVYRMNADWTEMSSLQGRDFIPDTNRPSRNWIETYIFPEDRERVWSEIQKAIRSKSVYQLEHRVIRVDGSAGWTFSRAIPLLDGNGEIVEWFGAAMDITERKRAEEALARVTAESDRLRRLYQTILSNTPDLAYVFDLNHRFTYANEALLTMWGKTAAEALGKNCLELGYEPWHAAMHDREIEQVIATKASVRGAVPFSGTHGRRIYDYIFTPVLGADGSVEAIAGTTRDVTEMKHAEDKLREAAERFRFMAESMPQKIVCSKPDGSVDYMNSKWIEYTGLTAEQIQERGWTNIQHPEEREATLQRWQASLETGDPYQSVHRIRRADGVYRWHLSRAHALRDPEGRITMWIGSSTEIHEQKETEENLRRANKDLEQFAYAATHDLQEPLRTIKIYGDLLARRYGHGLEDQAHEFVGFMYSAASHMEALVRDLLTYTRAGDVEPCFEPTSADECLNAALANLAGAIDQSKARIVSGPLPAVRIHNTQLQQVFQNLIGNAIKYRRSDSDLIVTVSASLRGRQWQFTVSDTGIGIEPQYKEHIFGLFKRLHTNDSYSGTGVGLALCQRIIERSQGRIWVESEPGSGSQFHFTLPASDDDS